VAAEILGISRVELHRRGDDGIYPFLLDEEKGWRWYPELELRKLIGLAPRSTRSSVRSSQDGRTDEGTGVRSSQDDPKSPSNSRPKQHVVPTVIRSYTAETAKLVFCALKIGKTMIDIVTETGLHPMAVRAIAQDYADMKGDIIVTDVIRKKIEQLPLQGEIPIKTADQLLAILEKSLYATCSKCGKHPARVCTVCIAGEAGLRVSNGSAT
jgi:hypothetical protein